MIPVNAFIMSLKLGMPKILVQGRFKHCNHYDNFNCHPVQEQREVFVAMTHFEKASEYYPER